MPFAETRGRIDPRISMYSHRHRPAASAFIFLRSTSAWYNKDVDGPTPFTIAAPTRQANDTLWVIKAGFGQLLAAPAGWIALPAYANGNLQLYRRLATNTAADDFPLTETTTRNVVAQMACFGNNLGETVVLGNLYQGGTLTNNTGGAGLTNFVLGQITSIAAQPNNIVIAWYMRERNFGTNVAAASMSAPTVLANSIGSIAHNQTTSPVGRLFCGWEFQEEVNNSPLIAGANITYAPIEDFSVTTSQMQRIRY